MAVVFDLFGTLVDAPTPAERTWAADRLSAAIGCPSRNVDDYLRSSWRVRHDGSLPTVPKLAEHILQAAGGPNSARERVESVLRRLGRTRLEPESTVVGILNRMRGSGLRLGVLSDASAEVADAWPDSPLSAVIDAALFSCTAGCTKPDQRLYTRVCGTLGAPTHRTLYVGDGGGDELQGAIAAGLNAVAVRRRGHHDSLVFGQTPWPGPTIDAVEYLSAYLAAGR